MSNSLLDSCYSELKEAVDAKRSKAKVKGCVSTDGWTDIAGNAIVNYMYASKNGTQFLESVATGSQRHTAEWISQDLTRVLKSCTNWSGACTDNTNANKAAWAILKTIFPAKFFYGCAAHALHLFVQDIFSPKKKDASKKQNVATLATGERVPEFPFANLVTFASDCRTIVKFVKKHHVLKAEVEAMQAAENLRRLALPGATRWGSILACFTSLLASEKILHALVTGRDFLITPDATQRAKRENIKNVVTRADFLPNLRKCIALLTLVDKRITEFQNDLLPISDVYKASVDLPGELDKLDGYSKKEVVYLKHCIGMRFEFVKSDCHGIAFMLDPRYAGREMSIREEQHIEDKIVAFPPADDKPTDAQRTSMMSVELTRFRLYCNELMETKNRRYTELVEGQKTVHEFWLLYGSHWPTLMDLALAVFGLVASSAACERNFSTFGFLQPSRRTALGAPKLDKLVYIKTNYNYNGENPWTRMDDENDLTEFFQLWFSPQAANKMSSSAEQEAQWRQQRAELYEELYEGGKKALNREGVRKTRQTFTPGATLESKPYVFPGENDGVALICAPIPVEMAERCHAIGKQLTDLLPREPETNNAVACVTRRELMHVTLFHTSHPGDLAPNAKLRFPQDVAQLKTMCTHFAPFRMAPVKVLMASSGAIIMLFQCLPATEKISSVVNEHAEFSVDHIRRVAKETFSYAPKTDTRVIIHATLGRVLSPDVSEQDLDRLRAQCDAITAELAADPQPALFDKLWFVEETHHLSPQGPKTDVLLLGGGVHEAS